MLDRSKPFDTTPSGPLRVSGVSAIRQDSEQAGVNNA